MKNSNKTLLKFSKLLSSQILSKSDKLKLKGGDATETPVDSIIEEDIDSV